VSTPIPTPTQTLHPAFGTVWDGAPNGQPFVLVSGTQKKVPMSFYYKSDPGLIRYQEVSVQKVIRHAIRFTADRTTSGYVYPARHFAGVSDPTLPPMGMRVRLKGNYDISGFSANNKVILTAMKKYGMILADNGVSWQFSGEPNPDWDDTELHDLRRVPGSAFEVVKMGSIQR
jgi:hypothetical protein